MASFAPIRGTRAQIQATPIVDGQFLVETDQGVDNMIYMDEGSTRTIVGGNTITGVLPELYIYSETGSVVTVEDAGGTSIPTSQVGTDHWICEVPDYGVYTIYSVLSGETTTKSINVDDCMIYTIDDSHFHCNVVVTYPSGVGATCTISGGGETYSAPALNPPDTSYKFVVHGKNTTYTITTNVDGVTKTKTITTGTTLDQTYNVSMPYARVNLTVEAPPITGTITITDGTTTITKTAMPNITLYLDLGTWTISGSDGVDPYDTEVVVDDFNVVYEADLSTAPNGATVTPTDDIQTWLLCAKIKNKTSYKTLDDVFADKETLQKLISSENAVNYMVRSLTWVKSSNAALVPTLSADNGKILVSSNYTSNTYPYKVFDDDWSKLTAYNADNSWTSNSLNNESIGYDFDTPVRVKKVRLRAAYNSAYTQALVKNFTVQYSDVGGNNDADWTDEGTSFVYQNVNQEQEFYLLNDVGEHRYWRIYITDDWNTQTYIGVSNLQFYPYYHGITEDEMAMRYIGEKNYASNECLDNGNPPLVPQMTSATTPYGQVFSSSDFSQGGTSLPNFQAFDRKSTTRWTSVVNDPTPYIGYHFTQPVCVRGIKYLQLDIGAGTQYMIDDEVYLEYSTNGINYTAVGQISLVASKIEGSASIDNNISAEYWRIRFTHGNYYDSRGYFSLFARLQFYEYLIKDYYCDGICDSTYYKSVLNQQNPIMTGDTTPSGQCFGSSTIGGSSTSAYWGAFQGSQTHTNYTWYPAANEQNSYVGYKFTSPVDVKKVTVSLSSYAFSSSAATVSFEGSTDGLNYTPLNTLTFTGLSTTTAHKDLIVSVDIPNNETKYQYFKLQFSGVIRTSSSSFIGVNDCRIDCREDVDETVYYVWSAADDTILATPQGGGSAITITTNNDGYGTIAKSSLPNGTYTFTSSKAKDPDNLNNDYSDSSVVISNGIIEVALMPDNALYWYGYESADLEDMISTNGWTRTNFVGVSPTRNINSMSFNTSGNTNGVARKNKTSLNNVYVIAQGVTAMSNVYGFLSVFTQKTEYGNNIIGYQDVTSSAIAKTTYSLGSTTNGYPSIFKNQTQSMNLFAFWYE